MKKFLNLMLVVFLVLLVVSCGVTAKKTGAKKSNSSAVAPIVKYTLKVKVNNVMFGKVNGVSPEGEYPAGTILTMTAKPNPGWKFEKWLSDDKTISGNTTAELTAVVDKDKTVRARFISADGSTPIYKMMVNVEEGQEHMGSADASLSGDNEFAADVETQLVAIAEPGYKFVQWTVKEGSILIPHPNSDLSQVTTVAEDCVITATFAEE